MTKPKMTDVQWAPGERVRIIIPATYKGRDANILEFADESGAPLYLAEDMLPRTIVERVGPPGWPPQVDDIWADRDGEHWHALGRYSEGEPVMALDADAAVQESADLLAKFGPLRLVFRRVAS